ncbi:hypothetical protein [Thermomonas carbonis]|uniref:YggN family protein n=1 Tax=Thermomonas carbonis TaxID=1463158 RepID=A0A7G9SNT0_9GAMM|nr:hypothetical protein [Thermomonas carbonis]QNN69505.1 hypothetical protein H9L16_12610 [Thermomonas carbonis]GHB93523.1 hypothetical protein GCM10010080_00600 [Thermomonas carbonis]
MKHAHTLAAALIACLALAACSEPPAPPAPPAAPAPPVASANDSFIGRHVGGAIEQARKELATQNISIGDGMHININGRQIHSDGNGTLPKAEITPQGDLLIEGKSVTITAAQRAELLAYRGQILGIAEAGMAIGAQGANIAGHAVSGAIGAIFGGKEGEEAFEKKIEAEAAKIEAEAMKLCTRLPALLAGQQALAASLPEFKPYARMTQADVEDCGKDVGKGKGIAVTSGA